MERSPQTIYSHLERNRRAVQLNEESFGKRIPMDGLLYRFASLAEQAPSSNSQDFLFLCAGIVSAFGRENGLYIRATKNGIVELQEEYPISGEITLENLAGAMTAFSNAMVIDVTNPRMPTIHIRTAGLIDPDTAQPLELVFMQKLDALSVHEKESTVLQMLYTIQDELVAIQG